MSGPPIEYTLVWGEGGWGGERDTLLLRFSDVNLFQLMCKNDRDENIYPYITELVECNVPMVCISVYTDVCAEYLRMSEFILTKK